MTSVKGVLGLMGRYHLWGNRRICQAVRHANACGKKDVHFAPDGTYFGSIHATLAHISGVDDLWYRRVTGAEASMYNSFYEDATPPSAWSQLYPTLDLVSEALERHSVRWITYVAELNECELAENIEFLDTRGAPVVRQRGAALLHVFNHGTHHRGQIHAALTSLDNGRYRDSAPALDLPLVGAENFTI